MSQAASASTGKNYGLALVCRVWALPRSTVYWRRRRAVEAVPAKRRGPQGGHCSGLGFLGQFRPESYAALATSAFCFSLT